MHNNSVLYQIKSLEKSISKVLMNEDECKNINRPLTMTQINIIHYLLNNSDVYQKDLENALDLSRATLSEVLKTMEKNKLIERVVSSNDLRMKKVILNENTKHLFESKIDRLKKIEDVIIKDLDEQELITFNRIIGKMIENIEFYGREK